MCQYPSPNRAVTKRTSDCQNVVHIGHTPVTVRPRAKLQVAAYTRAYSLKHIYSVHLRPPAARPERETTRRIALSPMASRAIYDSSMQFQAFNLCLVLVPSPSGMYRSIVTTIVPMKVPPDHRYDVLTFASACIQQNDSQICETAVLAETSTGASRGRAGGSGMGGVSGACTSLPATYLCNTEVTSAHCMWCSKGRWAVFF